jgi:exodeoxyribonuclease V gamma subunit
MPAASPPPGLLVLHGNRAEHLAQVLVEWLHRHPLAPLEEDVVLVQSNGMAEWFKMAFAQQAGVCAATRVELPGRFQWRLYRQTLGRRQVPTHSPFDKTPLTWRLMQRLPSLLHDPAFAPVAGFLQEGEEPERPLQLARRLADLFDQYQIYRADWLQAWAEGRDVLPRADGTGPEVPDDQRWQPALWRELLNGDHGLSEHERHALRPELHARVVATLRGEDETAAPLPRRVVLFGMTHLPLALLELLAALATRSQVLLALPNPCRFHWADIIDGRELLRQQRRRQPLRAGRDLAAVSLEDMHAHAHPLLASWGRQSRDFIRQLDAFDDTERLYSPHGLGSELARVDLFDEDQDQPSAHLLAQVQARIRDLVPLPEHAQAARAAGQGGASGQALRDDDRSVVFHQAHSAMRELEVLHDQLLSLLANPPADASGQHPPLAPRDIVVMVPDIAAFEPAIRAVFGQYPRHDARHIPFDIADLSARDASPLMAALEWLLRLPQQRCTFSELCDLLDVPALARRFGLKPEALPQLTHWMAGAGLRWGLDVQQRGLLKLDACGDANSALWALRRMLLGYASGAGPAFAEIEPHAEVGGLEAELAGSLALLLERLAHWWALLREPATPSAWAERARALLPDFFTATDDSDRATLAALDEALSAWLNACEQAGFESSVPLAVAREAWLESLNEPTLNRRFRAGGVTFCTLMPMRAIPFEVVCLLGMNEGDYPRRAPRIDFDLMGLPGHARPGDRSRRDDDRQLMLEALLSARRVLYVSWAARNPRDNSEQPPSVLVSQLRDYLRAGWGEAAVAARTVEHPLQPFSRRYFEAGQTLLTYAKEWRQAHDVALAVGSAPQVEPDKLPPFVPDPAAPLSLRRLAAFVRQPVRAFFRERLSVWFDSTDSEVQDEEAFSLAGLEAHSLLQELLDEAQSQLQTGPLQAAPNALPQVVDALLTRTRRAGRLPLGGLGELARQELAQTLSTVLGVWLRVQAEHAEALPHRPLAFEAGDVRLQDWLTGLHRSADNAEPVVMLLSASRLCGKPNRNGLAPRKDALLDAWLLALVAAACGQPLTFILVGRDATLTATSPPPDEAAATLNRLLLAWRCGQQAPLPVARRTALAWLERAAALSAQLAGDVLPHELAPAFMEARSAYEGGFAQAGEVQQDACLARLFPDFDHLLNASADDEHGHPLHFADWATWLYEPLRQWVEDGVSAQAHPSPAADLPGTDA